MPKAAVAQGHLEGDSVVVPEAREAARLHGKGSCGEMEGEGGARTAPGAGRSVAAAKPDAGGARLRLRRVEAAWLASEGRLQVTAGSRALAPADLLAGSGGADATEVEFLAYADLRGRGLLVRPWQHGWAVWPRGASPQDAPEYEVAIQAERDAVAPAQVAAWAQAGTVLAVVDEDGAVTYYRAALEEPAGDRPAGALPQLRGTVLSDRVLVADGKASQYRAKEHLGVPTGAGLVLSFTEAESLRRRGVLEVPGSLAVRAAAVQPHFQRTLPVYEALRAAGVVAKSGFKFGTHLRGYRGDPDASHAEWLIQCALPNDTLHWADLSRAIRVAHGVRKKFLLALGSGPVQFAKLAWFKP